MKNVEEGRAYKTSELLELGYVPAGFFKFEDKSLVQKYGHAALRFQRGNEECLLVRDNGLLKVLLNVPVTENTPLRNFKSDFAENLDLPKRF